MSIRLDKPWLPLEADQLARVRGQLGVYELANADGEVVFIGYAGGRSRFGLRGELEAHVGSARQWGAESFRFEVNMSYLTRHRELLMAFEADHGRLPARNTRPPKLGTLHPD